MSYRDHTTSCACWCDPLIVHVRGKHLLVVNERDARRLEEMGVTEGIIISPPLPTQRTRDAKDDKS